MMTAAIACVSCSKPAVHSAAPVDLGCDATYAVDTRYGRVANNAWNARAVGAQVWRQCVRKRQIAEVEQYGWSWNWPADSNALLSFPQVVLGWRPWDGGASSHPRLPMRIADVGTFRLAYDIETTATGRYSLATTLWLTRTGTTGESPNPKDISTDLMIWTDGFGFDPFGSRVGEAIIDGMRFEIWVAHDLGDDSGDGPRWNYVAFRSADRRTAVSLDLLKILQHAASQGFISSDHYISNVEVGNEVMSGGGETWIKALSLQVEPR